MGEDGTGKPLTFLQSIGQQLAAEKLRAQERLKTYGRDEWNFAIVGLNCDLIAVNLEGLATFRKVVEPPGVTFLAGSLENRAEVGTIGCYSLLIKHELAVSPNFDVVGNDAQAIWS